VLITSPAEAVAKYCDNHVCVCLSVREDIPRTTCAIFTKLLSMLPMAVGRSSSGTVRNPKGNARSAEFFPIDKASYNIAFGTHTKRLNRSTCRLGWVFLARGTACYVTYEGVTIQEGKGAILGGNMCRQTYIYNCQLDWSVQRHTTGAECLIASVGRVLSATSGGYGLHTVGEVWISTMALFQLQHIAPSGNLFIYLFTKSTTEGPEGHW